MFMVLIKLIEIQMRSYPLVYSDGVWNMGQSALHQRFKECVYQRSNTSFYTFESPTDAKANHAQLGLAQYIHAPLTLGILSLLCHDGILEHHQLTRANEVLF